MADRDPMGILPSAGTPDVTGEARAWPDAVAEGTTGDACIVTVRREADLDALDDIDADEIWARFSEVDEDLMMEAFVRGVQVLIVPDGMDDDLGDTFDPEAFLTDHGDTLRDHDGTIAYRREGEVWRRAVDDA